MRHVAGFKVIAADGLKGAKVANSLVRLWRRWTLPGAVVRTIGDDETDQQAIERYWREHPESEGCSVRVIRRVIVEPIAMDSWTKH